MTYRRLLLAVIAAGLLASLVVAVRRERHEAATRTVEIAIDDGDFVSFARGTGVDQRRFLDELHAAGATSLAIGEELGGSVGGTAEGAVFPGPALIDQADLTPLRDPVFAGLQRSGGIRPDEVYVVAFSAPAAARFAEQLPLKFGARSVRTLRSALPAVYAVRTTADYFGGVGLGLPADRIALALAAGLHVVPRLQNDETFGPEHIRRLVASLHGIGATTVIFFGLRNEVLGYPNAVDAAAAALRGSGLRYGSVESYDPRLQQLGDVELGRALADRTVRVQAIARPELDRLRPDQMIGRYELGVSERNVRVVYYRLFLHPLAGMSIEQTNVELVRRLAARLQAAGMRLGPASPFGRFSVGPIEVLLASLAVPGILLWILAAFGVGGTVWFAALVAGDLVLVGLGYATHHDLVARKALALVAGLAYPAAAALAIGWAFRGDPGPLRAARPVARGAVALVQATLVTLGGALAIVGLLTSTLTMLEIERFSGVKYVLVGPALIVLGLYLFCPKFGANIDPRSAAAAPVRVAQLLLGVVLVAVAFLVLQRSGNQSDIAPSALELSLRSHLSSLLQVRPRFKEFLAGFPALMLLPALVPVDRRRWGWLFALTIGMGLGDVIDTFSHLHTPLAVSALRIVNGAVLGGLIGAVAVVAYRRFRPA